MNASLAAPAAEARGSFGPAPALVALPVKLLHAWIAAPTLIFLLALTAMLFRPPDVKSLPLDRIAFLILVCCAAFRVCMRRERLQSYPATWPMLALMVLGLWGVLSQPYDSQTWSLFAAKWVVPFTLFHLAGFVFRDKSSLRKLEIFFLFVLTYLTAISVLFLFDGKSLIFPRFIVDEGIGIHADRARGPFLQAVANGVCLNILGIVALDSFRRRLLNGWISVFLLVAVPLALLATRTRAVWLSAAISVAFLALFGSQRRLRRAALSLCILAGIGISGALFYELNPGTLLNSGTLIDRLQDRSPLDFRAGMYRAGWEMFSEKLFLGWGNEANVQPEVAKRVSDFHPEYYVFHNTYLELAVERGIVGLVLYAWLMICFLRLWKAPQSSGPEPRFLDSHFRKLWPVILGVYLLNASAVVMSYQFVNALLFTIAGVLAAQNHRARQIRWQPA